MNPERLYSVILGPHVSEKTTLLGEDNNQYTFKVASSATKPEIKQAVETLRSTGLEC
jgi:large subunit ribosomal protein L23